MDDLSLIFLIVAIVVFVIAALEPVGGQPGRFKVNLIAVGLAFFVASFLPAAT